MSHYYKIMQIVQPTFLTMTKTKFYLEVSHYNCYICIQNAL